jgi:hypothetical protein
MLAKMGLATFEVIFSQTLLVNQAALKIAELKSVFVCFFACEAPRKTEESESWQRLPFSKLGFCHVPDEG